ncbi:MAG: lipoxygenase [Chamaesiphon sp.]|nr:lipoxygenase [Chamaesiphon sp.]
MGDTNSQQQGQTPADLYQYNYDYIEPIAMVDKLPQSENFSMPWIVLTAQQVLKLAINTLVVNLADLEQEGVEADVKAFLRQVFLQTLQAQGTSFKLKLISTLQELFPQMELPRGASVVPTGLQQPLPELNPSHVEVAVAVPKGIETALQEMLQETAAPAATARGVKTPLRETLKDVPSTTPEVKVEAEVSANVKAALQQPLQTLPATESEIEQFVRSNFIKILGIEFLKSFAQNLLAGLKEQAPTGKSTSLDDYRKLFAYIPLPDIANTFESDRVFASMRVAGPNPAMLARLTTAERRFPVTAAQYQAVMGASDDLEQAMREGRVYIADYAVMTGALNGTYGTNPETQKYTYAPLAMFAVPQQAAPDRSLLPVAIQCGQFPAEYPVITPATGAEIWQMAKTVVQIADANYHEAIAHFACTHLFVESFVITTHRQLDPNHPLYQLLVPHFQGTLAINYAAHESLVAPRGGVNDLLSSTIDNSRVAIVKGFQAQGFNAQMLPRQLRDRGVDDAAALPIYPYRDDGLLVWGAIHDWVSAYLGLFYSADADVTSDRGLQNWAAELVAFDGGRVQDFGDSGNGKIETLAYLVNAVATIIFTASAQHAAVNFSQNGIMSFAPAMPTAGYVSARSIAAGNVNWFDLLPPLDQAQSQLNLVYLLGSVYFTKLGYYEEGHFTDPRVAAPLQAFQQRLQAIDDLVDDRNKTRPVYDYLKPDNIPQSINI